MYELKEISRFFSLMSVKTNGGTILNMLILMWLQHSNYHTVPKC